MIATTPNLALISNQDSPLRAALVAEYAAYRDRFNKSPNMWSTPNVREEAGYCLQYPAPMQIFDNLESPANAMGYWSAVRALIVDSLADAQPIVPGRGQQMLDDNAARTLGLNLDVQA